MGSSKQWVLTRGAYRYRGSSIQGLLDTRAPQPQSLRVMVSESHLWFMPSCDVRQRQRTVSESTLGQVNSRLGRSLDAAPVSAAVGPVKWSVEAPTQ